MIVQKTNQKIAAYFLIGLTILIGSFHYWQPITISPTDGGERFGASLFIIILACLIPYGYRFARIAIGAMFLFFASINLLILLAYVRDLSLNSLGICCLTLVLGFVGGSLLNWKSVRIFEEEREEREKRQLLNV